MKSIAIIFTTAPHGSAAGREGLDALLAVSALSEDVSAFFIGDGVLQLQAEQQSELALSRNHCATFKVLPLYDVDERWICAQSLRERGLALDAGRVLQAVQLEPEALKKKLDRFDVIFTF